MNIDKIYEAAVAGNLKKLESCLRSAKGDINQMIQTDMGDGVRGYFPMLFSVLVAMNQHGLQPQALEMLVRYGVDVNGFVLSNNNDESLGFIAARIGNFGNIFGNGEKGLLHRFLPVLGVRQDPACEKEHEVPVAGIDGGEFDLVRVAFHGLQINEHRTPPVMTVYMIITFEDWIFSQEF